MPVVEIDENEDNEEFKETNEYQQNDLIDSYENEPNLLNSLDNGFKFLHLY